MKPVFLALLFFLSVSLLGQGVGSRLDSLNKEYKKLEAADDDKKGILVLNEIAGTLGENTPDTAIAILKTALEKGEQLNYKEGMGECLLTLGELSNHKSEYSAALSYLFRAVKLFEQLETEGYKSAEKKRGEALGGIGIAYDNRGNFPEALKYYISALKLAEKIKDNDQRGTNLLNIGILYFRQNEFEKALDNFQQSFKLAEETPKLLDDAVVLGNIGSVYNLLKQDDKALEYLLRALKIVMQADDKPGISSNLVNIGSIYLERKEYDKALNYYFRGLNIDKEIGDKTEMAIKLGNIGWAYCDMKNYKEAEKYLLEAIALEKETGSLYYEAVYHDKLSQVYEETKQFAQALNEARQTRILTDSLFNSEKHNELASREANYLFEKKENEERNKHDNEVAMAESQRKRQNIIIWSVCCGLILVMIFSFFLYKRFRIVKSQKQLIEDQKELVEEKQKEIMDSIHYAKRIQLSLLPNEKMFQRTISRLNKN